MFLLREAERCDSAIGKGARCPGTGRVIAALPHRAQPEHGDLPRIPIVEPVEAQDLRERRHPRGIPSLVWIARAVARRGQKRREQALLRDELQKIGVKHLAVIVLDQPLLAAVFEPVDRRAQQPPRLRIEMLRVILHRMEQQPIGCVHHQCVLFGRVLDRADMPLRHGWSGMGSR